MNLVNVGAIAPVSLTLIVVNLVATFIMTLIIGWVYKQTHRGLSYSQSFVFTLVMLAMITAIVMMVIGNNLVNALGILGAVALIRFRTPVKDTKDTAYLFLALAVGMAMGTRNYAIGTVGPALILLGLWGLERFRFGSIRTHEYVLSFVLRQDAPGATSAYEPVFRAYLKQSLLLNINSVNGTASELTYHVRLLSGKAQADFVKDLSQVAGVERVQLVTSRDDVEY